MKLKALLLVTLAASARMPAQHIRPVHPEAIKKWRDARFGMFIHWETVTVSAARMLNGMFEKHACKDNMLSLEIPAKAWDEIDTSDGPTISEIRLIQQP